MSIPNELELIAGAQELHDWFRYRPRFHDAEIVNLHLNRQGPSLLVIYTWEMTKEEVDARGYYVTEKHVIVGFAFEDISELDLHGFSCQNVIFGLDIEKKDGGFALTLDPCYGLAGTIEAKTISIRLKPGKPSNSGENQ